MKKKIISAAFLHAIAATAYIALVTTVMTHGNAWFGEKDNQLTAIAVLMLFVLSATVMGSFVFLRPVLWYLDGKKKEAFHLFLWIIAFFFALTIVAFVSLAIVR